MINARGLRKSFGRNVVIDNLDIGWPRTGMIGISGPSGSGKSTLMKALAGLIDVDGSLCVCGERLDARSWRERTSFRKRNIGLLFQSYRLFDQETAAWNIALPLVLDGRRPQDIKTHVDDALSKVGLPECGTQRVATMSGGQRQRVALARAFVKQPRILLADEPTGALDDANRQAIFDLLKRLSKQRLVIVVSHEEALLHDTCDLIYGFADGRFTSQTKGQANESQGKTVFRRLSPSSGAGHLPWSFCFRHAYDDMKRHRWRHLGSHVFLSIALLGLGIGQTITAGIADKMLGTLGSFIGPSGIAISRKDAPLGYIHSPHTASEEMVADIAFRYRDMVAEIGVSYRADFTSFFPDRELFFIAESGPITPIPTLQARHIAEFLLPSEANLPDMTLAADEVALMLPSDAIEDMAFALRCEKNIESVNVALSSRFVTLGISFANYEWNYEDEQLWRLKTVALGATPHIIHSNPRWNEWVFETSMRFPATSALEETLLYPWILRKGITLLSRNSDDLIAALTADMTLAPLRFDHVGYQEMTSFCPQYGRCRLNRVLVVIDPMQTLSLAEISYLDRAEDAVSAPLVGTEGGYLLYPESLFAGFANETFFTSSWTEYERIVDWLSYDESGGALLELPPLVARGYYRDQSAASVRLKSASDALIGGRFPENIAEIAISSGLAQTIFGGLPNIGSSLFIGTRLVIGSQGGAITSEFVAADVVIVGIVSGTSPAIFGMPLWSIAFYRDVLGFPMARLRPQVAYYEVDEEAMHSVAERITNLFIDLEVSMPQAQLRAELMDVTQGINRGVALLALLSGGNALLLAMYVVSLAWHDMVRDRQLLLELGATRSQVNRLIEARMALLVVGATAVSFVEMVGLSVLIERLLADYFVTEALYKLPVMAMSIMGLTALILYLALLGLFALWGRRLVIGNI